MSLEKIFISSGQDGIKTTLLYMRDMVKKSDSNRIVRETAAGIIKGIPPQNLLQQVQAITAWVRKNLKYVRDTWGVEELTNPVTMLYNIKAGTLGHSSDCDDFAILLSALLRSVGFPTRLEAVSIGGGRYDHARMSVGINGKWYAIEGTRNMPVGARLPSKLPIMSLLV